MLGKWFMNSQELSTSDATSNASQVGGTSLEGY